VPTINSYANKQGYYIRARPSSTGNITYKIKNKGNPIVRKYGLKDGDEISWSTIQSFKALGVIYTEKSGTLGPDDFEPDPEQLEKTELFESDAKELFSVITTQFELSAEERTEIRSILGLRPEMNLEAVGDQIGPYLESHADSEGLSVWPNQTVETSEKLIITTWIDDVDSTEHDTWHLRIIIMGVDNDEFYTTHHCIHLCEEHGIEYWHTWVPVTPTWDIKQVALEQKSVIFPQLLSELRAINFDLGDPSEVVSPPLEQKG
jgi:hypothetical protein